jgi:glucose/arabinose dehydrogenase
MKRILILTVVIIMVCIIVTAILLTIIREPRASKLNLVAAKQKSFSLKPFAEMENGTSMVPFPKTINYIATTRSGSVNLLSEGQTPQEIFNVEKEDKNFVKGFEPGLMCVALHPSFEQNKKLYLSYTVKGSGDYEVALVVNEYTMNNTHTLDKTRQVLKIMYTKGYHHAGTIAFNPVPTNKEMFLYLSSGDGGPQGDPQNKAQNMNTLEGKLVRIDVNNSTAKPEIVASGLRNPWRFSFDAKGRIFIADVGLSTWESIYLIPDVNKMYNFGWNYFEGTKQRRTGKKFSDFDPPIWEYPNGETGAAVIGGYFKNQNNTYIFADYLGIIRAISPSAPGGKWEEIAIRKIDQNIFSMGYNRDVNTKEITKIFILGKDSVMEVKMD